MVSNAHSWTTLAFGLASLLVALARPNLGIALLWVTLFFNVFPTVSVGSLEFSGSTLLVIGLFLRAIAPGRLKARYPLASWQSVLLVALGLVFFLSTLTSDYFTMSLRFVPNLVIYWMLLFALMKLVRSSEQLWRIASLIMVLGFVLSLWRVELRPIRVMFGLPSLGINGAVFEFHLAVAIALVTGIMLTKEMVSGKWRLFSWLALLSLFYHGLLYQTRAGWLAWVGMIFAIGLQARSRSRIALIAGAASLVALGLVVFADTIDANLAQSRITAEAFLGEQSYSTVASDDLIRLVARDAGWHMFLQRPILGWGSNSYSRLKPAFVNYKGREANDPGAFNAWLIALVEWGIMGTAVVALIFLLPIWLSMRSLKKVQDKTTLLAFAFSLGTLGIAIHLFFIDLLYSFAFATAGLALAAARIALDSTRESPPS